MTSSNKLPKFDKPPLVEVAVSIQFEPIKELQVAHFGLLWEHFRDKFPSVSHHRSISNKIERLGVKPSLSDKNKLEFINKLPLPRCWYAASSDGGGLIQVQNDRFVRNWRQKDDNEAYPTFDKYIKPHFFESYKTFNSFLSSENLAPAIANQIEITYVNQIKICDVWKDHSQLGNVFNFFKLHNSPSEFDEIENANISMRSILRNEKDGFLGRLHISIEPVYSPKEMEPIFLLQLIARGRPLGDGLDGIEKFFDIGHAKIVNTFTNITTEQMHKVWERNQ